jgi:hypothetical protein
MCGCPTFAGIISPVRPTAINKKQKFHCLTLQRPVLTTCTTWFNAKKIPRSAHSGHLGVLYFSQNKQQSVSSHTINKMDFITQTKRGHCAVRTEFLSIIKYHWASSQA